MRNAKDELLGILAEYNLVIKAAKIVNGDEEFDEPEDVKIYLLPEGYSGVEYKSFLQSLDFLYDNGWGGQELFGLVWLTDGTWLARGEYDGSEWWEHRKCPEIPDYLKGDAK